MKSYRKYFRFLLLQREEARQIREGIRNHWFILRNDWDFNSVNSYGLCGKVVKEIEK